MEQLIVITAVGGKSTAVVNELARVILDCGGNIKESRMAALGSEFMAGDADGLHGLLLGSGTSRFASIVSWTISRSSGAISLAAGSPRAK
jgi:hypothetical protein